MVGVISGADAAILMNHERRILESQGVEADYRKMIADRLRLLALDSDSCWLELEGLCEKYKGTCYINDFPIGAAFRLCEAIGRDGGCADRVLSILSTELEDYGNNPRVWLECFAARLAGVSRQTGPKPSPSATLCANDTRVTSDKSGCESSPKSRCACIWMTNDEVLH